MERLCFSRCSRFTRVLAFLQIILGGFVILISITTLHRFYSIGFIPHMGMGSDANDCSTFNTLTEGYADFDLKALSDRVEEVVTKLSDLQDKLEATVQKINKDKTKKNSNMTLTEFKRFLEEDVIPELYGAHIGLRLVRIPKLDNNYSTGSPKEDPLINFFTIEETRKYITAKDNREGKMSVYGTNKIYNTIGHACVVMRKELEEYIVEDVDLDLSTRLATGPCHSARKQGTLGT